MTDTQPKGPEATHRETPIPAGERANTNAPGGSDRKAGSWDEVETTMM